MEQPQDIDYAAVIDHLQGENERLRERVMHLLLLADRGFFAGIADWWGELDGMERYQVCALVAIALIIVISIINLFRRD